MKESEYMGCYPTFSDSIAELQIVLANCTLLESDIRSVSEHIVSALQKGNKVLSCGNGGSAADALHLAEEFVGRYSRERVSLPALCLNSDVTALTCIGNDYGYESIFSRQIEGLGKSGDLLVVFSTSGNSPNALAALQAANKKDLITILIGGRDGGKAKPLADFSIIVPSHKIARIQEVHTLIIHQIMEFVDSVNW